MSFMDRFFTGTVTGLQKTLDLTWRRNEAIVSNIANAETPQYRAVDVNFAGELDRAFKAGSGGQLSKTDSRHLDLSSQSEAHLIPDLSGPTKPDGNNVDIDIQMGQLSHNYGEYSMATDLLRKKLQFIKFAIREGGR